MALTKFDKIRDGFNHSVNTYIDSNGNLVKGTSAYGNLYSPSNPGQSGAVIPIHGIDGSVSSTIQAGEIQSFTYEASLAGKSLIQDKSKLKVIAMLIDRNTGRIANASQTAINDYDPSAIHAVSTTSDNRDAGRCSLDGRRLNSPQRGINIIRMNDGTVKKVIVK